MNAQIRSVADIYAFNAFTVKVSISDLSQADAGRRSRGGDGSSILFLLGHLLSSRAGLLKRLGETTENPWGEVFGSESAARDAGDFPPLARLAEDWDEVAARLAWSLDNMSEEQLEAAAQGYPVPDQTVRGALMFMAWHESYHVGQIGQLRVDLGYPSVEARLREALSG